MLTQNAKLNFEVCFMCLFHKMTLLHCSNLDLGHVLSAMAALKVTDEICYQGQGVQPAQKDSGISGHPCK